MKTSILSSYEKAKDVESILLSRMEERFRDGNVSDELADFFSSQNGKSTTPLFLSCGKKRKGRTLPREQAATAAPPRGSDSRPFDIPPLANRGVTFHGPQQCNKNTDDETNHCPHIMGGYDGGVTLGLDGTWNENRAATFAILETAKRNAMAEENPKQEFEMDGRMYIMATKSAGSKGGGPCYKYVFEGDGVKFYIHNNPKGGIQPVRLVYLAEGLIGRDLFLKHARTIGILEEMGFSVTQEKLSRVDMQVMLPVPMEEIFCNDPNNRNMMVCSAQKRNLHYRGEVLETFTIGSINTLELCIYDKRAEMFALMKRSPVKFALMLQECFGEDWLYDESPVTRIEFRCGRDLLKSMDINSMNDLLECEAGLAICVATFAVKSLKLAA